MKSTRIFLLLSAFVFLYSCEKDNYFIPKETPVDPNVQVSLAADIQPIFDASCATSGCHDGQNDDSAFKWRTIAKQSGKPNFAMDSTRG